MRFSRPIVRARLGRFKKLAGALISFALYVAASKANLPLEGPSMVLEGLGALIIGGTVYQLRNDES